MRAYFQGRTRIITLIQHPLLKLLYVWLLAAGLVACRSGADPGLPEQTAPTRVVAPTPLPREGPGRLAYIGSDGNVYVTGPDGANTVAVTEDATVPPEHMGLSYHRVSWSPAGQLALAAVERSMEGARSRLYVVERPGGPVRPVGRSDESFVIYIHWSPRPCGDGPACGRLAYLIEEQAAISLRLVEFGPDTVSNRRVGSGRPFYFSWSEDGRQILSHTGGARQNHPQARLTLFDLAAGEAEVLPQVPGLFIAPAWSPRADHWLLVSAEGRVNHLQQFSRQPVTLASAVDKHLTFAWSPQGDRVAYAVQEEGDEFLFGPVQLFDRQSGRSRQVTEEGRRIAAFFWSPDGQKLAYLTRVTPNTAWLQWRVYDLVREQDRGYEAFNPSFQMRMVVGSFNQYAQSHRFWSPDSRYLVYADRDSNRIERVWLVDTLADKWADPLFVAEGSIGIWSWQ